MINNSLCPCGSQRQYNECCKPLHDHFDSGTHVALTPEQLMRSRFCAFVLKKFDYIIETHHVDFIGDLTLNILEQGPHPEWLALDVLEVDCFTDNRGFQRGTVTFKAWYKLDREVDAIFEKSDFVFENGRWYYTRGEQMQAKLPGRNDPCICGSGKKFKQCCLR
ncbi:YchJ family protein [Shewanella sp. A25]|nr:YchJ family protein [Shewanella shenzhenensis]